jgi:N-acetylated-alpha-linked acidic dipeptidase
LIPLLHEASKEVEDPIEKRPVYEVWKAGVAGRDGKKEEGRVDPIGSGSDHAVFLQHLGAPALDMSFVGPYGVYHSVYDNYFWMTHFGDPGMKYSAALARIWAHIIIDLACRPVLPLDYETYARHLLSYVSDWAAKYEPGKAKARRLLERLEKMGRAAAEVRPLIFDSEITRGIDRAVLKRINGLIIGLERAFTDPQGIPRRPWYKHLVFGARYTYAVLLLPALTEASEAGDSQAVDAAIRDLENAVSAATVRLEKISRLARK